MGIVPSDLEIAQAAPLRPLTDIGASLGLAPDDLEPFGRHAAKIELDAVGAARPSGKYVVVTAVTPTPLGEGKTTTAVGLVQGLGKVGRQATAVLRQPSLGPVFGIKGGAAGGGCSGAGGSCCARKGRRGWMGQLGWCADTFQHVPMPCPQCCQPAGASTQPHPRLSLRLRLRSLVR